MFTSISDIVGERYEYGDYGKVSFFDEAGLSLPGSAFNVQHLYTGRSIIAGTGLYDYRFRVMEPETGRFGQRDPLGYVDSLNVYAYVVNNPNRYIDPFGLLLGDDVLGGGLPGDHPAMGIGIKEWVANQSSKSTPVIRPVKSLTPSSTTGSVLDLIEKAAAAVDLFNELAAIDRVKKQCKNVRTKGGTLLRFQQEQEPPKVKRFFVL